MSYRVRTNVKCTNPDLIASGSTFNKKWEKFLLGIESGYTQYYCGGEYINDALFQLSMEYPHDTFTGVTWIAQIITTV